MYQVKYSKNSYKYLKRLLKRDQTHILSVIERSRIRPESHFERLVGDKVYKLRAGKYRIIADINKGELLILVIKIGNRKSTYD